MLRSMQHIVAELTTFDCVSIAYMARFLREFIMQAREIACLVVSIALIRII